jgi:predicted component of type VI protein secretion system
MTQELIRQLFNTARNADSLQSFERVAAEILSASIADTADYKRMFEEAVSALAAIDNALGIDPDEAGGAAPILEAIERLRNDGECRSCVDDKCVTGPECVTLGRDAAPTPERADAEKDAMDLAAGASEGQADTYDVRVAFEEIARAISEHEPPDRRVAVSMRALNRWHQALAKFLYATPPGAAAEIAALRERIAGSTAQDAQSGEDQK